MDEASSIPNKFGNLPCSNCENKRAEKLKCGFCRASGAVPSFYREKILDLMAPLNEIMTQFDEKKQLLLSLLSNPR